jgi:D-alanyl-D-alanine carboxypeptidase
MFSTRSLILGLASLFCASTASAQFVAQDPRLLRMDPPRIELDAPISEFAQPTDDAGLRGRLQRALDSVYALTSVAGRYGLTASVIMPGGEQWSGTVGISHPGVPLRPEHLVEIASNTKTFVTAAILQLEEEGKLAITDRITKYLPQFENVDTTITIKQLLDHSSGVFDYLNDDPEATLLVDAYFLRPTKVWKPEEVLESIGAANFKPGSTYKYSNTGFTLLGMIIESVTQHRFADEIRARFLDPLQLSSTFAGSDEEIAGEFTHQWVPAYNNDPARDLGTIDKTGQLSLAWSAGYIVSTPTDMARWAHTLYRGKLLTQSSMTKMLKMNNWPDGGKYGLGTAQVPYGSKKMYGHSGHLFGFSSMMYTNPKDSVTLVVVSNSEGLPDDITLNDHALGLLAEIYRPVTSSVNASQPLRIYQIEGGRTLKIELPESASLVGNVQVIDVLGRVYTPHADIIGNGIRIELDAMPRGVYNYSVQTSSGHYTGKISKAL